MVFFNHATRQMTIKIVYYGPGLCGKTTNLNTIYGRTSQKARGEMVSLNTETDRTLFFDLLPMDVGTVGGFKAKLQLYTVPGQVFYNSTRKLVLKGVDGIVFVADSQVPMFDANKESLQNLDDNLRELGMDLRAIPMVFQWNKRDLKNVVSLEQMERELNPRGLLSFHGIAQEGQGVFETLRGVTRISLEHIVSHHLGDAPEPRVAAPEPPPSSALSGEDLGSGHAWDETPSGDFYTEPKAPAPAPPAPPVLPMAPAPVRTAPRPMAPPPGVKKLAVPALPKAAAPLPPAAPRMKAPSAPGLPGVTPTLRIPLPASLDGEELDIRVEVRCGGELVGEAELRKAAPALGAAFKLSLDLKRG